jgi:hypothetical protein
MSVHSSSRTVIPAYRQAGEPTMRFFETRKVVSVGEESATLMMQLNMRAFQKGFFKDAFVWAIGIRNAS